MALICPAVLASNKDEYKEQINRISHMGHRMQIDLTDGEFAGTVTVNPQEIWWPAGFKADIHLMYKRPTEVLELVLAHSPHMVIVHAEAEGDFESTRQRCLEAGTKLGVALLAKTSPEHITPWLDRLDHVLIFSGDLGSFGGHADPDLLYKAEYLKKRKPDLEVGWDGGINSQNISTLVAGGVDVLDVGGFIQKAADPMRAFRILERIVDENRHHLTGALSSPFSISKLSYNHKQDGGQKKGLFCGGA